MRRRRQSERPRIPARNRRRSYRRPLKAGSRPSSVCEAYRYFSPIPPPPAGIVPGVIETPPSFRPLLAAVDHADPVTFVFRGAELLVRADDASLPDLRARESL